MQISCRREPLAEAAPIVGMTRLEFDECAANLRWFSKVPVDLVLAETRRFAEEERWMAQLAEQLRGG